MPDETGTAETARNGSSADLGLAALAREIRATTKADTVFGEPIRHGAMTLVPVARAAWGLGGGYSEGRRRGGAGGGAAIKPVGYIVMDASGAHFCPIRTGWTPARAAVLGLALGVWLAKRRRR